MPTLTIRCEAPAANALAAGLQLFAKELNALRYEATAGPTQITLTPLIRSVRFFDVSPVALLGDIGGFLSFFDNHPPRKLADAMAEADTSIGRPTPQVITQVRNDLTDDHRSIPSKLELLYNVFATVYPGELAPIMRDAILPWFFDAFPGGRVFAVTLTSDAHSYEFLIRNLASMSLYGFEPVAAHSDRSKPFTSLLPGINERLQNILKFCSGYNGPFVNAFCIGGIFTTFLFVPGTSVHRRSPTEPSFQDCLEPHSTPTRTGELHSEGNHQDTIRAIHRPRTAAETEEWLRYWIGKADEMFDRLYNLTRSVDAANEIDFDTYWRSILQFDRVLFEIAWCCSLFDPFLRKILSYAVVDKITAFMENRWAAGAGAAGTQKFISALTRPFLVERLHELFKNPFLAANGRGYLEDMFANIVRVAREGMFPPNLLAAGHVDWRVFPRLADCATLPGSSDVVSEDVYSAQVVRAIRNTHHGFSDLYPKPFAVLSTSAGAVSEDISLLPAFLGFAMLDDPDSAIGERW